MLNFQVPRSIYYTFNGFLDSMQVDSRGNAAITGSIVAVKLIFCLGFDHPQQIKPFSPFVRLHD